MGLYLLSITGGWGYDSFDSMLIRAATPARARKLANKNSANEGEIWEDVTKVHCTRVSVAGKRGDHYWFV